MNCRFCKNKLEYVFVDLGDFGSDSDNVFLSIYTAADALIQTIEVTCCSTSGMVTLGLALGLGSANDISYALFGSTGSFSNSVFADNFTFTGANAVPVPAALFMFAPALLGFLGLRRKEKNTMA